MAGDIESSGDADLLHEITDDFLDDAERCYRLAARATLNIQRESLLKLAREFEMRAEATRLRARNVER